MASLGMNNAPISQGEFFVILGPEHATASRATVLATTCRCTSTTGTRAGIGVPAPLRGAGGPSG
jgi:hypothetical protein